MKIIFILLTLISYLSANQSVYNLNRLQYKQLVYKYNVNNQKIVRKNTKINNLLRENSELEKKLKWYKSQYTKAQQIKKKYSKNIKYDAKQESIRKYRAKRKLKKQMMLENTPPTTKQLKSKNYQKNLIWYQHKYLECKASLDVM